MPFPHFPASWTVAAAAQEGANKGKLRSAADSRSFGIGLLGKLPLRWPRSRVAPGLKRRRGDSSPPSMARIAAWMSALWTPKPRHLLVPRVAARREALPKAMHATAAPQSAHAVLSRYWGFSTFRTCQEDVISSVLDGNDNLVVMVRAGLRLHTSVLKSRLCACVTLCCPHRRPEPASRSATRSRRWCCSSRAWLSPHSYP